MSELTIRIEHADSRLLEELRSIAKTTAADPQKQIKTLAQAILSVEEHCASVEQAIHTIAANVTFKKR